MKKKSLQITQLDTKMRAFPSSHKSSTPPTGWIKAIRLALGMSLRQLAAKLNITRQSAQEIEVREQEGAITLKSLRDAANALDMELVYGFVPRDGSLDSLIDRKAHELAAKIVARTSATMALENQKVTDRRLKKAVAERAEAIKQEMPKILWD